MSIIEREASTRATTENHTDVLLNGRVVTALKNNPYLNTSTWECETRKGRVILKGEVLSYFQKQMAQESLRSVEGILEILNELEVAGRCFRLDLHANDY